jgi:adhesin transport system membrane fusion protein
VKSGKLTNVIFYLICGFFIIAIYWSMNTEIDQVVRAEAMVEPTGKVQVVQNRYPGSIDKFSARIGDSVTKGQVLFWLKQEDNEAAIKQNRITFHNAKAETARYQAEAYGKTLDFPHLLPARFIEQQRAIYQAKSRAMKEQLDIIEQEIASKSNAILQAQTAVVSAQDSLTLTLEEMSIYKPLVDAGVEPKIKLLSLQRQQQDAHGSISQQTLVEAGLNIDIDTLKRRKNQVVMDYRVQAEERLAESTNTMTKASAEYTSLTDRMAMAEVKAPSDGIISAIYVTTQGAVVSGGETLAEIVPQTKSYRVLAKVQPADISLVNQGQACRVSFTAYDFAKYGSMDGKIVNIAQNITETNQGLMYYEVWVETTSTTFSKSDVVPNIMPGMVAQVDIVGEKSRIIDYILTPLKRTAAVALTEQ